MTTYTTVYRVEVLRGVWQGHGPYQGAPEYDDSLYPVHADALSRISSYDESHPTPEEEPDLWTIRKGEFCGFESIAQAREWFHSGALEALLEIEDYYAFVAYRVPEDAVRYGRFQVLFQKDRALTRQEITLA